MKKGKEKRRKFTLKKGKKALKMHLFWSLIVVAACGPGEEGGEEGQQVSKMLRRRGGGSRAQQTEPHHCQYC